MIRHLVNLVAGAILCGLPFSAVSAVDGPDLVTIRDAMDRGQWKLAAADLDILLASPLPPDLESECRYLRAQLHREQGETAPAIEQLRVAVRLGPPLRIAPDALYLYGELLYETDRFQEASDAFARFGELFPDDDRHVSAMWFKAEAAAQNGRCSTAVPGYERILRSPATAEIRQRAQYGLAWCRRQLGDEESAEAAFSAAADGPDASLAARARFEAGASAYRRGDHAGTVEWLEGRRGGPAEGDILRRAVMLGQSYFALGEHDAALPHLLAALEGSEAAERPALLYQVGWIQLEHNDADGAHEYFSQLAASRDLPDSLRVAADYGVGVSLMRLDRLNQAIGPLERVRQRRSAPWGAEARYALAWVYHRLEDFERSQAVVDELRRMYPDSPLAEEATLVHGENLFQAEQYEDAIREFHRRMDGPDENRDDMLFRVGVAQFRLENFPASETAFRELLNRYPDSAHRIEARFWLGESLYRQNRYDAAATAYQAIRIADPDGPRAQDALYGLAWCDYSAHRYAEAGARFGLLLESPALGDREDDVLFRRGNCHYNLGHFDLAVNDYDRLLRRSPQSELAPRAAFQKAWSLHRLEHHARAAETFDEVRQRYPDSDLAAPAAYWAGFALFRDAQYRDAADMFGRVGSMAAAPESLRVQSKLRMAESYFNAKDFNHSATLYETLTASAYPIVVREAAFEGWIESLQAGGRHSDATDAARQLAQAFPDNETSGEALYRIGVGHIDAGRPAEGIQALRRYLEVGVPDTYLVDANRRCAEASIQLGDKLRAAEYFRNAAYHGDEQDGIEYRFEAGRLFYEFGKYQLARDEFRRVVRLGPEPETLNLAYYNLGLALKETGEAGPALDAFEKVARADGVDPTIRWDAMLEAGLIARDRGDGERAQEYLCEAGHGAKGPTGAEAQYWCAEGFFEAGHFDDAVAAYRRVIHAHGAQKEWGISAHYRLAECFERLNRWTKAREHYQTIVAMSSDDTWSSDANGRLDWIKENPWVFEEEPKGDPTRWEGG